MSIQVLVTNGNSWWKCDDCGRSGTTARDPEAAQRAVAGHDCDAYRAALDWQEGQRRMISGISMGAYGGGGTAGGQDDATACRYRLHREGTPASDPLAEILAAIAEPLGLGEDQLPAYGIPGPHGCRGCLGYHGPGPSGFTCLYCTAWDGKHREALERKTRTWRRCLAAVAFAALMILVLYVTLSVHGVIS